MQVKVSFLGPIKKPSLQGPIQLPQRATLADLLATLKYPPEHWKSIVALKNGHRIALEDILQDEDSIELTIRIGGG